MINMGHCSKCGKLIVDKYLMCTDNKYFHWNCLRCQLCGCILDNICHVKDGHILCKNDYMRLCSSSSSNYSCKGCLTPIENNKDYVVKIPSSSPTSSSYALYHPTCIQCSYCKKNLNPGDQYILNKMNQSLICLSSSCLSHYSSTCSAASSSYPSTLSASLNTSSSSLPITNGKGKRGSRSGSLYKK